MEQQSAIGDRTFFEKYWGHLLILLIVFGSLAVVLGQAPFGQDQNYHNFADKRGLLNIPNFGDVASNLLFLLVGLAGVKLRIEKPLGRLENAWFVMFAGIALVGIASAYYHWNPNDYTLVWDRMSLTVGFMGLFIAVLGEYVSERFRMLLMPAVLLGVAVSVLVAPYLQALLFRVEATDALHIARNEPTMNLGFDDGGTYGHEFGHAIGFGHDVTRYYTRAVTIMDVEQLGGTIIEQLAGLFEVE